VRTEPTLILKSNSPQTGQDVERITEWSRESALPYRVESRQRNPQESSSRRLLAQTEQFFKLFLLPGTAPRNCDVLPVPGYYFGAGFQTLFTCPMFLTPIGTASYLHWHIYFLLFNTLPYEGCSSMVDASVDDYRSAAERWRTTRRSVSAEKQVSGNAGRRGARPVSVDLLFQDAMGARARWFGVRLIDTATELNCYPHHYEEGWIPSCFRRIVSGRMAF